MSTPVDESTPTLDRSSSFDLVEVPPMFSGDLSGFSSDLPDTQRYHVFQRLKLLSERFDPFDPYWAEIITAEELIAASDYYDLEREAAHALRSGRTSYAKIIKDGIFARLRAYFEDYDTVDLEGTGTVEHSLDTAEPIIVGELHCPHVDGATATFENKIERSEKLGVEVTAAGLGGGGRAWERLHASTARFSIAAPECKLICAHLRGHYVIWEQRDTKERIVLTNVTGVHKLFLDSLTGSAAYRETHLCEDPANFARCLNELDSGVSVAKDLMDSLPLAQTPGTEGPYESEEEWTIAREYTGRWGSQISVGGGSLGAGATYTSRFVRTIKMTAKLPYGFHYISRYRSARELPQQWTAQRLP
ncbi:MAG TPA: hypothetical protein VGJ12_04220 [Gemmatimonadaceae bacterium]|jgi:hypothetical protein